MSEQEISEPERKKSKQHQDAGFKMQNERMKRLIGDYGDRMAGLEQEVAELHQEKNNKPEPGQDVPWKHADLPSYLPKCPGGTCGKSNPNFPGLEKLAVCKNCKHPVGTPDDIKNDVVGGIKGGDCPWCGGKEAEMPEVKHD